MKKNETEKALGYFLNNAPRMRYQQAGRTLGAGLPQHPPPAGAHRLAVCSAAPRNRGAPERLPYPGGVLSLRPMTEADLPAAEARLRLPHVARWWTPGTTPEATDRQVPGADPQASRAATHMLTVTLDGTPAGWCQWYRWADHPADAGAIGARDGEIGIDYAIGDPAQTGKGAGTALIAALTAEIRRPHPSAGILADPDAANTASRRVLEKNGFRLVAVKPIATEATDAPMAIYRLLPAR